MASALDVLGSLLQGGMSKTASDRIGYSLGERGMGGSGGILDQILGGATRGTSQAQAGAAGPAGGLGNILGSILGDGRNLKAGGLGALAGAILGGGAKGAVGGGALALLGSMALQALRSAGQQRAGLAQLDSTSQLAAGLRAPANEQEMQQVESVAGLIVRAMINAAKADGTIDEREVERIAANVGNSSGAAPIADEVVQQLRKPMETDNICRAASNPQVAAEVYAASLLAIDLDTDAEREYMEELAGKLSLDDGVVRQLHATVGAA